MRWNNQISTINFLARATRKVTKNTRLTNKIYWWKEKKAYDFLADYDKKSDIQEEINKKEVEVNSIIWTGWLQGEENAPEIVKFCLKNLRKHSGTHKVICITEDNLSEYLPELSSIIIDKYKKGEIIPAHFMDIIRIKLLRIYGGLWVDATVLITQDLKDYIFQKNFYSYRGIPGPFHTNPANYKWCTFFFSAMRESEFMVSIDDILNEYWQKNNYAIDYFLLDYAMSYVYFKDGNVKHDVDAIELQDLDIGSLMNLLRAPYNKENMILTQQMLKKSWIFKLTYKDLDVNEKTIFDKILNNG